MADHVMKLREEIDKRVEFITKYCDLGEAHMVEFLVSDHWNVFVDPNAQEHLMSLEEKDLYCLQDACDKLNFTEEHDDQGSNYLIQDLKKYLKAAENCRVSNTGLCKTAEEVLSEIGPLMPGRGDVEFPGQPINTKEYMCFKKSHEVEEMSKLVYKMCLALDISNILDFGSGKGYLGTYLALRHGFMVTGIDCSESNSSSAFERVKKYSKYWRAHLKNKIPQTDDGVPTEQLQNATYNPVTAYVDDDCDLNSFLTGNSSGIPERTMLTGLHTCGDLCCACLRVFINTKMIRAVCAVGCCYHFLTGHAGNGALSTEEVGFPMSNYLASKGFRLGRNTIKLGLKALEKTEKTEVNAIEEKSIRSLFYRAVLSVILEKELGVDCRNNENIRIGKTYSKSKDFPDYVRRCLKKLGLTDNKQNLTDERLLLYMTTEQPHKKSLMAFNLLREAFGPAVEAVILLDRLLYMEEQAVINDDKIKSYLVQLFDPVKSPRCYAIVAVKQGVGCTSDGDVNGHV